MFIRSFHTENLSVKTWIFSLVFVLLACCLSTALAAPVDEDFSCTLTPRRTEYQSGESVQFLLSAQMSLFQGSTQDDTVKVRIPIPTTTPECSLPMFRFLGTEDDYVGVPMYPISRQGNTIYMYLVTLDDGSRCIEVTLRAGETIQATLNINFPNGLTEPIDAFRLEPEIVGGTYTPVKAALLGGTTRVTAQFGWDNIIKTQSEVNLGSVIEHEKESVTYTLSASSRSSAQGAGSVFTNHYVLSDTMTFTGMGFASGAGSLVQENAMARYMVDGETLLEFNVPSAGLTVTPRVAGDTIVGFDITYMVQNTTLGNAATARELNNLMLSVRLLLNQLQCTSSSEAKIDNTATLDAYSVFYDEAAGKTGAAYHHQSSAAVTAYTSDAYDFSKSVFLDEACTRPAPQYLQHGTTVYYRIRAYNESGSASSFTITDELPDGMVYQSSIPAATVSGQTVTWQQVNILANDYKQVVLCASVDQAKLHPRDYRLPNVATLTRDGSVLGVAKVENVFRTADDTDGELLYTKTSDKASIGVGESLTYSIVATNPLDTALVATVEDEWPGEYIRPTRVVGCDTYEFFDGAGTSYTMEQLAENPDVVIKTVKFYNVAVAGKSKTTLKISGTMTHPTDQFVNVVGVGSAGPAEVAAFGLAIEKHAYPYDVSTHIIGTEQLSVTLLTNPGEAVCFKIKLTNKTDKAISNARLVDTLPVGLTLIDGEYHSVISQILLVRSVNGASTVSILPFTSSNPLTTQDIYLAGGESVTVYLFVRVEEAAVETSKTNGYRIINSARATFNSLQTPAATASIFTPYEAEKPLLGVTKNFILSCDLAMDDPSYEDFTYLGTQNINYSDVPEAAVCTYEGAYNLYRVLMMSYPDSDRPGASPIDVYEFTDVIPDGMEFVGVCTVGNDRDFLNLDKLISNPGKLCGKIIKAGETGQYTTLGGASYSFAPQYDAATKTLRIIINDGNAPYYQVQPRTNSPVRNYVMIITRTTELKDTYTNTFTAKVDNDINKNANEIQRTDGTYNYISSQDTVTALRYVPGLSKYYTGAADAEPTQTLNWQIQVKSEDFSHPETSTMKTLASSRTAHCGWLSDFVVVDYLPEEFEYVQDSASIQFNRLYYAKDDGTHGIGELVDMASFTELPNKTELVNPSVEEMSDGRTKLTWTFTGTDMRLFNIYQGNVAANWHADDLPYKGLGFAHIINYDTQWKISHPVRYDNYLNAAEVLHSYDFQTISSGVADYEKYAIKSTAVVSLFGASGTTAFKAVTNPLNNDTAMGNDYLTGGNVIEASAAGDRVTYTLCVQNVSQTNDGIRDMVIIDELPRALNDTGVVNRMERGSGFSVFFDNNPDVSVYLQIDNSTLPVADANFKVEYGMSSNGLSARGDWAGLDTDTFISWQGDPAGMNAIRIVFDSDYVIPEDAIIRVYFSVVLGDDAKPGLTAWNSFGYAYKTVADYEIASRLFAEPLKVGVKIPDGIIAVTKSSVGLPPAATDRFDFVLTQNGAPVSGVWYTLGGDAAQYTTDSNGQFTMGAGQTALLHTGVGSGYQVSEAGMPDGYTLHNVTPGTPADGTVSGRVFSASELTQALTRVSVTFTNQRNVAYRNITATKVWDGDANPSQPASVTVQLYKDGAKHGLPAELNEANHWSTMWQNLPENAVWTVREVTALPIGYTSSVTGSVASGFVITNTYTAPVHDSVRVSKVWDGDANPNQPTSVAVQLYKNGTAEGAPVELNALNHWSASWQNLPVNAVWTVREVTALPTGYASAVTGSATSGFVITNTYTLYTVDLTLKKVCAVTNNPLANAVFTLARMGAQGMVYYGGTDSQGRNIWGTSENALSLATNSEGQIVIDNLEPGEYILTEMQAPLGYVQNTEPQTITIANYNAHTGVTRVIDNEPIRVPLTGDAERPLLWSLLILTSLCGMLAVIVMKRRGSNH